MRTLLISWLIAFCYVVSAQESTNIPRPIVLSDQDGFYKLMAAASLSFIISEFASNEDDLNYYQIRVSNYSTGEGTSILGQNFGIEKRLSHWFGLGLEIYAQQWQASGAKGLGMGLNAYYRWYAFGKKRLSPFIEYGTGGFHGFKPFPSEGTKFTFHLTSALGLEYQVNNQDKIRITYGHLHQSNNDLFDANPGLDAAGITLTYLFHWN